MQPGGSVTLTPHHRREIVRDVVLLPYRARFGVEVVGQVGSFLKICSAENLGSLGFQTHRHEGERLLPYYYLSYIGFVMRLDIASDNNIYRVSNTCAMVYLCYLLL